MDFYPRVASKQGY